MSVVPAGEKLVERASYEATPVTGVPSNLQEIINISKVMAASGLFPDASSAARACGLMILGVQFGIPPAQALTAIHVVKGKPMLHYSAILSKVRQHPGYDYDVAEDSAKRAEIVFYRVNQSTGERSECGRSVFTLDDAKRQGTQNMDRFPDTMLLARAASNGVKRYCPDVLNGMPVYTHGEMEPSDVYVTEAAPSKAKALMAEIQGKDAEPVQEAEYAEEVPDMLADDEPEGSLL